MSYLYDSLTRFGDVYALNLNLQPTDVVTSLQSYQWVKYNPRKNIPRYGLSITSLDGGLSGTPDLDSVKEYNIKNGINLTEADFNKTTELWPIVEPALGLFRKHLGRTHFIRMDRTGCFPPHRDQYGIEIPTFRLFIPIEGCNPPNNYFIIDDKIYNWDHGRVYFINTCKEHTVFTTGNSSMFIVANVIINEKSVNAVLNNLLIS